MIKELWIDLLSVNTTVNYNYGSDDWEISDKIFGITDDLFNIQREFDDYIDGFVFPEYLLQKQYLIELINKYA